jgi:two-component system nitrate/nitrite sensor histidine kinase NarX
VLEIVPQLRAGVQESYDDVRELLQNFRNRLVEEDLMTALAGTIDKFKAQTGIDAELKINGSSAPLPRQEQLQIVFIVQEALSNVRKHANAQNVTVGIEDDRDFRLTVQDDGDGFDAQTVAGKGEGHVGMNIMRERAERIHATLAITSAPGRGTLVSLDLPQAYRRAA